MAHGVLLFSVFSFNRPSFLELPKVGPVPRREPWGLIGAAGFYMERVRTAPALIQPTVSKH